MDSDDPHPLEDLLNPQYSSLASIAPPSSVPYKSANVTTTTASPPQQSPQLVRTEMSPHGMATTAAYTAGRKASNRQQSNEKEGAFHCPTPQVVLDQPPRDWRACPLDAPTLYIGPRALSIEQQKVEYLEFLRSQLDAGSQALKEQLEFYRAALHEHSARQKRHYGEQVDKEVAYLVGKNARDYEAQVMKLRHDADEHRALKEKEAHESMRTYEQKKAEEILRQKQHALLVQHIQKHKLMHFAVAQANAAQLTRSHSMTKLGLPNRPQVRPLSPNPRSSDLQKPLPARLLLVPPTVTPQVAGSPRLQPSRLISVMAAPSPMMRPAVAAASTASSQRTAGPGLQFQHAPLRPSPSTLAPPRPARGRSVSPCHLKPVQLKPVLLGSPANRQRPMVQSPMVHLVPSQKSLSASSDASLYRESPESRPTLLPGALAAFPLTPLSPAPKQWPPRSVTPQRGAPIAAAPGVGALKATKGGVASTPTMSILPARGRQM
eukprot:GEMP01014445.1.p1 GENE.GEMP01014445.1~~GEMP01014445.1.p1  ORF type:complete len:491 (+),score=134.82 GEMP01014445.1:37-1509(+)